MTAREPARVDAARLVSVAAELLAEHGPSALTARRIADAAGTSTMAIYSRFGGTGALLAALRADGFAHLASLTDAAATEVDDPVNALAAASLAYLDFGVAQPHRYRFMFVEPAPGDAPGRMAFAALCSSIEKCLVAGRFRPHPDHADSDHADSDAAEPPTIWAAQLWAITHGVTSLVLTGTVPAAAARHVLCDGLTRLFIGYGDDAARAARSVADARVTQNPGVDK